MNSVQVMGNLTRDPQIRVTKTGRAVASFSIAVNRTYTTMQGERKELTDYVNVVAWGGLAESVGNQLKKGNRVFVEGRYSTRSYEANDGSRRYVTEVNANIIAIPLNSSNHNAQNPMPQMHQSAPAFDNNHGGSDQLSGNFNQFGPSRTDDEIPF